MFNCGFLTKMTCAFLLSELNTFKLKKTTVSSTLSDKEFKGTVVNWDN